MGEPLRVNKSLIEPVYWQAKPNQLIDLGTITVEFSHDGKKWRKDAKADMQFLPDRRLAFVVPADPKETPTNRFWPGNIWNGELRLVERGVPLDVYGYRSARLAGDWTIFEPKTSVVTVTPESNKITRATFHLFNFPEFSGPDDYILNTGTPPTSGVKVCGQAILKADGWVVTIAAADKTDDVCKAIAAQGGYAITHVGEIARQDGSVFTSGQLNDLINCLHDFLSFVLGRWAGIAFPVGFDIAGNRVFEQWGVNTVPPGPWHGANSWFDESHGEWLSEVFPGFILLRRQPAWKDTLRETVCWYLAANQSGYNIGHPETGIIMAAAALERLVWTYCVQDKQILTAGDFALGGINPAKRLRKLACKLGMPCEVPDHLKMLRAQVGQGWKDVQEAIVYIRNELVHPAPRLRRSDGSFFERTFEAWELSLWYLEVALLHLCGHKGHYRSRLAKTVESVPWTKNDPPKRDA